MLAKSISRLAAVQAIYQYLLLGYKTHEDVHVDILKYYEDDFVDEGIEHEESINSVFFRELFTQWVENKDKVDEIIINSVFHNSKQEFDILYIGIYSIISSAIVEILYHNTPYKVLVNEYTNIASMLLEDNKVGFINSILDKLSTQIKKIDMPA